jgi:enoyl-CoA hydratase
MMENQDIIYEVREQIAWVTLNRPQAMNAITEAMGEELIRITERVEHDDAVRGLIFKGAGEKAFSAGMDLKERVSGRRVTLLERRQQKVGARVETQTRAVAAMTKPTIAAIRGYCVGGGLELALACDFRLATGNSRLGLTEVKRGLIPGAGGTQRLPRLVGLGKALEMTLTGRLVDGEEALRIGLVNELVAADELEDAAGSFALSLLQGAPIAIRFIKEALYKGTEMSLDQGLRLEADLSAIIGATEDAKEGPRAFAEKRAPIWQGK